MAFKGAKEDRNEWGSSPGQGELFHVCAAYRLLVLMQHKHPTRAAMNYLSVSAA